MYDVFISHNKKDKEWVRFFVSFLKFSGLKVFFDEENIPFGSSIVDSISNAIDNSSYTLFILTNNSVASKWVGLEVASSIQMDPGADNKKLIPVKLEDLDDKFIPPPIRRLKYVDLTQSPEHSARELRALLAQLGVTDADVIEIPSRITGSDLRHVTKIAPVTTLQQTNGAESNKITQKYANLFKLRDIEVSFVSFFGGWESGINEFSIGEVRCSTNKTYSYSLPKSIADYRLIGYSPLLGEDLPSSVRLVAYNWLLGNQDIKKVPVFEFAPVKYSDYRRISLLLDSHIPNSEVTFREKYAPTIERQISTQGLSNICGVGVFVITRDNYIVVTRYSSNVTVYPSVWGYTASGAMDWMDDVNPFREIERECKEEICHQLDLENTFLYQFGLDATKLFYQFTFFELSLKGSEDIISKASQARDYGAEKAAIDVLTFDLSAIVNALKMRKWEPAAKAGLITLCTKKFGYDEVAKALAPMASRHEQRERAKIEWSHRAQRQGDLAVMSARYPSAHCMSESDKYVKNLISFIGRDIENRNILEIGSGIGRVTKELSQKASSVTCVDLSSEMIARAKQSLRGVDNVVFVNEFIQDAILSTSFDVAISSLVLIHIPDDQEFREAVNALKRCSKTIFLFEHIDASLQVSSFTKPRSETDLLMSFYDYDVERKRIYKLFDDNILFIKLVKIDNTSA